MTSQVIYPHIEKTNNDDPAHLKRVPRVRVAQIVMDYLAYGWSVEEMNRQHPYLRNNNTKKHSQFWGCFFAGKMINKDLRFQKHLNPVIPSGIMLKNYWLN